MSALKASEPTTLVNASRTVSHLQETRLGGDRGHRFRITALLGRFDADLGLGRAGRGRIFRRRRLRSPGRRLGRRL